MTTKRSNAWSVRAALFAGVNALIALTSPHLAVADELLPSVPVIPVPRAKDVPFPGIIALKVDATDVVRGVFSITESIPVHPGHLVLLIPKWEQGAHSIQLPVSLIAGLEIKAGDVLLPWRRDPAEVYAFNIEIPHGVSLIHVAFKYLSPTAANQGRIVMTPAVAVLEWSSLLLYPAGYYAYDLKFSPAVRYPHGWTSATSLTGKAVQSDTVQYPTVDLDRLIDSPVMAGAHADAVDVGSAERMYIFWNQESHATVSDAEVARFRRLVHETNGLFGHGNYEHFSWLINATNGDGPILEHRRSSELKLPIAELSDPAFSDETQADMVAHEYIHSWNGKSRRPYDLWQPEYSTPQQGSLLWVYEGLTEYWGIVLAARSGFGSRQTALDDIAQIAAQENREAGREWRTLLDCTTDNAAPVRRPNGWLSYQRREDFYFESVLLWLEADQVIRTSSQGKRSLDDFAKTFFRLPNAEQQISTYTFGDLVTAMNKIAPYDWTGFFRGHLAGQAPKITGGLERSGYDLVYTDKPTPLLLAMEKSEHQRDLSDSIGAIISDGGLVQEVVWTGPAFEAGLTVGSTIEFVNGKPFTSDSLIAAIQTAANVGGQISLGTTSLGFSRSAQLKWSGGLRYPTLRRNSGKPLLDAILSPSGDP